MQTRLQIVPRKLKKKGGLFDKTSFVDDICMQGPHTAWRTNGLEEIIETDVYYGFLCVIFPVLAFCKKEL